MNPHIIHKSGICFKYKCAWNLFKKNHQFSLIKIFRNVLLLSLLVLLIAERFSECNDLKFKPVLSELDTISEWIKTVHF